MSVITQIRAWFTKAIPDPNEKSIHTQLGVHIEEVSEMFAPLGRALTTVASAEELQMHENALFVLSKNLKKFPKGHNIDLLRLDRTKLLDALCDQIVTAVGVAHMLRMDIEGALEEVADSNDSKFDKLGNPIFDENRKIKKGPNYRKPDLSKFI